MPLSPPGSYALVRQALRFMAERAKQDRAKGQKPDCERLLDEAGMRYNLSPLETSALARLFREQHDPPPASG